MQISMYERPEFVIPLSVSNLHDGTSNINSSKEYGQIKNQSEFTVKQHIAGLACNNRKPVRKENINRVMDFVDSKKMLHR